MCCQQTSRGLYIDSRVVQPGLAQIRPGGSTADAGGSTCGREPFMHRPDPYPRGFAARAPRVRGARGTHESGASRPRASPRSGAAPADELDERSRRWVGWEPGEPLEEVAERPRLPHDSRSSRSRRSSPGSARCRAGWHIDQPRHVVHPYDRFARGRDRGHLPARVACFRAPSSALQPPNDGITSRPMRAASDAGQISPGGDVRNREVPTEDPR